MNEDDFMNRSSRTMEREREDERDPLESTAIILPAMQGSDAVAEALVRAQGYERPPRNELIKEAREVGRLLAEDAYYSFPAGSKRIEGASIDLVEELQGVYGAIVSSARIVGQPREDRIHVRAVAIDLIRFAATERDHIGHLAAPRKGWARDEEQRARWATMQIQSQSSRAARNAIERRLPRWFVRAAIEAAQDTVRDDILVVYEKDEDGKLKAKRDKNGIVRRTLAEARELAQRETTKKWGITKDELEAYFGMPMELWTIEEVRMLRELFRELLKGKASVDAVRESIAGEATRKEAKKRGASEDGIDEPEEEDKPPVENAEQQAARAKALAEIEEWETTFGKEKSTEIRKAVGVERIMKKTPLERVLLLRNRLVEEGQKAKAAAEKKPEESGQLPPEPEPKPREPGEEG